MLTARTVLWTRCWTLQALSKILCKRTGPPLETPQTCQGLSNSSKVILYVFMRWRLHYNICNIVLGFLAAGQGVLSMSRGYEQSDRQRSPRWPLACSWVLRLPRHPWQDSKPINISNHSQRSYGHQNKLDGIRICPVTPPYNKRLRKPQSHGGDEWVPLKVTTKFLNAAF